MNIQHQKISKGNLIYILILISICIILTSLQFNFLLDDYSLYQQKYSTTNDEIADLENQLFDNNFTIENITNKYLDLRNKIENNSVLHDPTYLEALNFIDLDITDTKSYDEVEYNCAHFSKDVNNNAEKANIKCGYVKMFLSSGISHAIVAFNTSDRGMIYFEPQTDQKVILEIGKDYWYECVQGDSPGRPNSVVLDYLIFW